MLCAGFYAEALGVTGHASISETAASALSRTGHEYYQAVVPAEWRNEWRILSPQSIDTFVPPNLLRAVVLLAIMVTW